FAVSARPLDVADREVVGHRSITRPTRRRRPVAILGHSSQGSSSSSSSAPLPHWSNSSRRRSTYRWNSLWLRASSARSIIRSIILSRARATSLLCTTTPPPPQRRTETKGDMRGKPQAHQPQQRDEDEPAPMLRLDTGRPLQERRRGAIAPRISWLRLAEGNDLHGQPDGDGDSKHGGPN